MSSVLALQCFVVYDVARMFMQKTSCKRGKAAYFTFLVRQSFRIPEGPRSRTVCNVTKLPPHIRELIAQCFSSGVSLVLYDLTSVYFEGNGPAGISRYGYSRDHRTDHPAGAS